MKLKRFDKVVREIISHLIIAHLGNNSRGLKKTRNPVMFYINANNALRFNNADEFLDCATCHVTSFIVKESGLRQVQPTDDVPDTVTESIIARFLNMFPQQLSSEMEMEVRTELINHINERKSTPFERYC